MSLHDKMIVEGILLLILAIIMLIGFHDDNGGNCGNNGQRPKFC